MFASKRLLYIWIITRYKVLCECTLCVRQVAMCVVCITHHIYCVAGLQASREIYQRTRKHFIIIRFEWVHPRCACSKRIVERATPHMLRNMIDRLYIKLITFMVTCFMSIILIRCECITQLLIILLDKNW